MSSLSRWIRVAGTPSSVDSTALPHSDYDNPEPTNRVSSHRNPPRLAAHGRFKGAIMLRSTLSLLKL
jgi:hypothetical protein